MSRFLRVGLAVLFFVPRVAWADAIEPPPTTCPAGSEGDSSHCGPVCLPRTCDAPSDCRIGETCAARDLCLRSHPCGFPVVEGACTSGSCAVGTTCTGVFVCVPGTTPADAGRRDAGTPATDGGGDRYATSYCGCRVPRRAPAPGWSLAMLAVIAVVLVVRRRA